MSAVRRMSGETTHENAMTEANIRPASAEMLRVTVRRFFRQPLDHAVRRERP